MSREAFEAWFADYLGPLTTKAEKHSMWVQWQAARAAALEEAAEVADRHSTCANDTPNVIACSIRALKEKE